VDAVGGADCGAHHAGDAADSAGGVAVEAVDASEVAEVHAALFDGHVFSALFGVLHGSGGSSLAEAGEEVAHGCCEACECCGEVDGFCP